MAHPINDSPSNGRSEILRSAYNQHAFAGRNGVTPAHVAVDLRRRTLTPDANLEADVVRVVGELRDDGLVTGGHQLTSPMALTREGARHARNPVPPAIIGGRGFLQA